MAEPDATKPQGSATAPEPPLWVRTWLDPLRLGAHARYAPVQVGTSVLYAGTQGVASVRWLRVGVVSSLAGRSFELDRLKACDEAVLEAIDRLYCPGGAVHLVNADLLFLSRLRWRRGADGCVPLAELVEQVIACQGSGCAAAAAGLGEPVDLELARLYAGLGFQSAGGGVVHRPIQVCG